MTPDELKLIKADFRNFTYKIWQHLNLPAPTPIQYDICHYLQHGPKRRVIEAFRGVGKSWLTSAFVTWTLLNDPQKKILVVSASKARADDFATFVLQLIREVELLQHLQPTDEQRNAKIAFDVGPARPDHSPSVKSVGITGQLSGSRADLIVADDVEVPNNSATPMMRDKIAEAVKEFDAILKPGGKVVYLGTPQTEESLYNKLKERGYQIRVWPAEYPNEKQIEAYGPTLAPFILEQLSKNPDLVGKSTEPKRFSDIDLLERKASYGRSGYALQFLLDTRLSDIDRYPLKLNDLIVMDLDLQLGPTRVAWGGSPDLILNDLPHVGFSGDRYHRPAWQARTPFNTHELSPYTGSVMAIDPSGRGKDELGWAVVNILNGTLFLMDAGGFQHGYAEETLEALARIAQKYQVKLIKAEPNYGGGMFSQLLRPVLAKIYPCMIKDDEPSSKQKERRIIDTLEPVLNSHRLVVDAGLVRRDYASTSERPAEEQNLYRLFYQLTRITRERGSLVRDDRVDALAMAVAYWTDAMAKDQDRALREHRDQELEKELQKFITDSRSSVLPTKASLGRKTTKDGWIKVNNPDRSGFATLRQPK